MFTKCKPKEPPLDHDTIKDKPADARKFKKLQELLAHARVPNFATSSVEPAPRKKKQGKTAEKLKKEEKDRKNKAQLAQMCEVFSTASENKVTGITIPDHIEPNREKKLS